MCDCRITVKPNGPLVVEKVDTLIGVKGEPLEKQEVFALCRCGHSGNKPFCDGSHKEVGFKDD